MTLHHLQADAAAKKYVSIDIGGTAIKYGIIDGTGRILTRSEMRTEAEKGGPSILKKAVGIVQELKSKEEISGICISTAGMVDTEKGEIFYSAPLIPNYAGTRFKEVMEETFGIPCEVENDVNCAGLAESESGSAKGSSSTLMLTIGTGIGGCIVLDHKVFHGFSNSACEVGYMHARTWRGVAESFPPQKRKPSQNEIYSWMAESDRIKGRIKGSPPDHIQVLRYRQFLS